MPPEVQTSQSLVPQTPLADPLKACIIRPAIAHSPRRQGSNSCPLHIRRRPRVDDSHLPATLHPCFARSSRAAGGGSALLERSASQLLPPQRLFGMEQAVPLLADALAAQKRILIVGDFDCDGATSSALCVLALRAMGGRHIDFLVPNRFEFGYGLTPEIVELAVFAAPSS